MSLSGPAELADGCIQMLLSLLLPGCWEWAALPSSTSLFGIRLARGLQSSLRSNPDLETCCCLCLNPDAVI